MQINKSLNRFGNREESLQIMVRAGCNKQLVDGLWVFIKDKEQEDAEEENEKESV